jgi:hypothetical protein
MIIGEQELDQLWLVMRCAPTWCALIAIAFDNSSRATFNDAV